MPRAGARSLEQVVRHLALHLLKGERTAKIGVGAKRLKAGWDAQYLRTVLAP